MSQVANAAIESAFALSPNIRYVAIVDGGEHVSKQRGGLDGASASESDKYEELFINPVLLKLVHQRGNLDCGGAKFVVVRYGNFYQLVLGEPERHISVCFELGTNPLDFADRIEELFSKM